MTKPEEAYDILFWKFSIVFITLLILRLPSFASTAIIFLCNVSATTSKDIRTVMEGKKQFYIFLGEKDEKKTCNFNVITQKASLESDFHLWKKNKLNKVTEYSNHYDFLDYLIQIQK